MDYVLVDAPCSGTGTLRRNPDMKWRFDEETVPKLVGLQRLVFEKALSYLKSGGKIIYATCSILKEENEVRKRFESEGG
jgi:16S rRNA C967 or C1407 C5-methylase (RsmB/RsmF family)